MNNSSVYDDTLTDNVSTYNEDVLIETMNTEKAHLLIPATVYIIILMVSGLLGNVMVCFYYGFKTKRTTNSVFIVTLAVYDLIVCSICMPTEIVDIEKFYTFENNGACKVLRFLNYFAALGSIFTLIAIAADRFKKLCKPTGNQITIQRVRWITLAVALSALGLSWPSLIIYGSIRVNIPNDYGIELKGLDCTSTKEKSFRPYVWAFNGLHFVCFLVCSVLLIALYSVIGRSLYLHSKTLTQYKKKPTHVKETTTDESVRMEYSSDGPTSNLVKVKATNSRKSQSSGIDSETIRITLVMIAVTVLFIASFLPYLSLTIWRIYKGKHEAEFLSDAGLVGFKIGSRSFLLNSSLNPWIYGIFNTAFRNYFIDKLRCKG